MASASRIRLRSVLNEWIIVIVFLMLALAAVGGYMTYTAYENPGTTVETEQVSSWEANGTYTTAARVTKPNPLYPIGTTLQGNPAYFTAASPIIDGQFRFGYNATGSGSMTMTAQQTLILRSISNDGTGTTEYWRTTKPIGQRRMDDVGPGEMMTASFEWNVSRQYLRAQNISERLNNPPGSTQLLVVSTVQMEGTVNNQPVTEAAQYRLPIEVNGATFEPAGVQGSALTGSTTTQVTRQQTYGQLWRLGGPGAIVFGLLGLITVAYIYIGTELLSISDAERRFVTFQSSRDEFDDWITTAELPEAATDRPTASVETLEGLVDTAIDIDSRVLTPPGETAFYVPHDDLLCVYRPSPEVQSVMEPNSTERTTVPESSKDTVDESESSETSDSFLSVLGGSTDDSDEQETDNSETSQDSQATTDNKSAQSEPESESEPDESTIAEESGASVTSTDWDAITSSEQDQEQSDGDTDTDTNTDQTSDFDVGIFDNRHSESESEPTSETGDGSTDNTEDN